jgi:glutamate---cysteine ligase / carboxylate-amine ligase
VEHAFGQGTPFTVGVEEEVLLVDPQTRALAPVSERVLPALDLPERAAGHEAYAAEVELRSPPSPGPLEAVELVRAGRRRVREVGGTPMAVGLHPAADFGDAPLVDLPRYRKVGDAMRGLIRRTPECALHIHVGMPDPETAIRVFNGMRSHLPLLAGLAAGTPFWFGRDSGFDSARATMIRAFPGRGIPPAFRDYEEYAEAVERSVRASGLDDRTLLWWDVRPHPRFGTIEVREMDVQPSLDDAAALATLVHALALEAADRPPRDSWPPEDVLAWSSFRAARDGLAAEILEGDGLRPLREVAVETVARVRPRARDVGAEDALDGIERIAREGNRADRQRATHRNGGIDAVLDELIALTAE